jgi:hypothetical protein
MFNFKLVVGLFVIAVLSFIGCSESENINSPGNDSNSSLSSIFKGATTANGWYEEDEIYYIDNGIEEGVTERGDNQIYLIGGDRLYQAQVVLFIPGEPGYSPHWNVNVVNTALGVTVSDILASPYSSSHFNDEGVLFDDVEDILGAEQDNLVVIDHPGVVVHCPIIPEKAAEAPGNNELPEVFQPFDLNAGF